MGFNRAKSKGARSLRRIDGAQKPFDL